MRAGSLESVLRNFSRIIHDFQRGDDLGAAFIYKAREEAAVSWSDLLGPLDDEYTLAAELGDPKHPNITPYAIGQMALRHVSNIDPYSLGLATLLHHSAIFRDPADSFGRWLFEFHQEKTQQTLSAMRVRMAADGILIATVQPTQAELHRRRQAIINSLMAVPT